MVPANSCCIDFLLRWFTVSCLPLSKSWPLLMAIGAPGTSHPQYPAQSISYTPWGAISQLVNGCTGSGCTNTQETYQYNKQLQPAVIELGTTGNATADYCLVYNYYGSSPTSCALPSPGTNNNGNVMGYWYQDGVNSSFSHTATYSYDGVNQLTNAVASGSATYNLTFGYDAYGNMTCQTNGQTNGPCPNWAYNTSTNQLTTSGFTYDAAGNLTKDSSNVTARTWQSDAEGRVASVDSGSTWGFTYNALGYRVQWAYTGGADQHLFDPEGNWLGVAASYSLVRFGSRHMLAYLSSDTVFNHVNQLDATTMGTNHSGTAVEDVLFYPWGDQWQSSASGYSWTMPYRDLKTNTDFTTFRVYSPNLGRWLSPDPLGGDITNPQSLNRYPYVLNNPTTLTDPLGLQGCPPGTSSIGPGQCAGPPVNPLWRGFEWDPFQLMGIPVFAYGMGWIPYNGSQVPGPATGWATDQGTLIATTTTAINAYWGPTDLNFLGDAFVILGPLQVVAVMPPNPFAGQTIQAPPQPRPPNPGTAAENASIYASCVMNPDAFGAAPNESGKGAIQAMWYAPTARSTGPETVPINPGPPVPLNLFAATAANAAPCAEIARQR